jgi:molybdenum cofactor cytidylyltransferase
VATSSPRLGPSGVSAILLAAGSSRRFLTGNKLLAEIDGVPLISRAAENLAASRIRQIVVVTGPDRVAIIAAVEPPRQQTEVVFVHNPDHLAGMGTSIAKGIGAVSNDSLGALICPGDMPSIAPTLIDQLITVFEASGCSRIVYPVTPDGRQGNPVLWPRRHFDRLAALDGASGGKTLLVELSTEALPITVGDAGTEIDIDTLEELERFRRQSSAD